MNYCLNIVSLEQMALIKTAIELWNKDDIKTYMHIFYKSLDSDTTVVNYFINWGNIEDEVIRKTMRLSLPRILEEKISTFIRTVGSQILSWMDYHRFLAPRLDLPREFCWTPHGTIDVKKTAEVFVKDCNLDVSSRFKLACVYCLEDDISILWKKLPENFETDCKIVLGQHGLVVFWTSVMKNEVHKMFPSSSTDPHQLTNNQHAFEIAVKFSSRAAAENFLKKMTPIERKESLYRFPRYALANSFWYNAMRYKEIRADVLLFLLSELDEQDKTEVFKKYAGEVLHCFIHWPRQGLFMEAASYAWEFLSSRDYFELLYEISNKMLIYNDYNYRELFGEFWKQGNDFHKRYTIYGCGIGENTPLVIMLSLLFDMGDAENVSLILKSLTARQRERVIFSEKGKIICERLYSDREWDLLKLFIGECIPSKNTGFKEELEACLNLKENSNKFFQLIAELVRKDEDRMSE